MIIIMCCRLTILHTGKIAWPLKIGQTGCTETSVGIYHYKMRNNPEEYRFLPYREEP
jgi:hypothetical protein